MKCTATAPDSRAPGENSVPLLPDQLGCNGSRDDGEITDRRPAADVGDTLLGVAESVLVDGRAPTRRRYRDVLRDREFRRLAGRPWPRPDQTRLPGQDREQLRRAFQPGPPEHSSDPGGVDVVRG